MQPSHYVGAQEGWPQREVGARVPSTIFAPGNAPRYAIIKNILS